MVTKSRRRAESREKEAAKSLKAVQAQPANGNLASLSNQDVLRRLYACMLKCRMLAERAQRLPEALMHSEDYDFEIGREAVVVGATVDLDPQDTLVASPRNFAAHVAQGLSLKALMSLPKSGAQAFIVTDYSPARAVSFDPFNLGTGLALAHRLEKKRNVVVALCPEENSEPDRWREAMKFAGIHKLPIVYVKSGSAFGLATPESSPALEEQSFMARDCGFPGIIVDGKDAVAVWRVVHESIHRARNGAGPTLVECEMQSSPAGDPLERMEHYMKQRGIWDDKWRHDTADRIAAES
jgi:pyruvate dehydrogenase E1 component alpha subunit